MPVNEQQIKRDFNSQRLQSTRSASMDAMLARRKQEQGPEVDVDTRQRISQNRGNIRKIRNVEKSAKRIGKGATKIAAGNKVSGVIDVARGAKGLANEFFSGGFTSLGMLWFYALLMAVAKDSVDIMFMELVWWADWIIDIVVGGMLWVYLAVHGARKSQIVKIAAPILEILPFTGIIPWWTMSVIYVGIMKEAKKE